MINTFLQPFIKINVYKFTFLINQKYFKTMNKLISLSLIIISVFLTASCAKEEVIADQIVSSKLDGDNNILYVTTALRGANEVPAVTTTATGDASGTFNKTSKILNLTVNYTGITLTAWHIHKAAVGVNGGVVFNLGTTFTTPFVYTSPAFTAAQETDLTTGLNYLNLHSATAPGGEIRGQLSAAPTKATGAVTGKYNKGTKILTLNISYAGITPTAWHIHKGAVGTSGPVVFDLGTAFSSPFNYSTIALTAEQETALLAGLYYVNIHSKIAPGGEIRGQIAVN